MDVGAHGSVVCGYAALDGTQGTGVGRVLRILRGVR